MQRLWDLWTRRFLEDKTGITLPTRHNGEEYRGINILMLWVMAAKHGHVSSHWMTYKQAQEQRHMHLPGLRRIDRLSARSPPLGFSGFSGVYILAGGFPKPSLEGGLPLLRLFNPKRRSRSDTRLDGNSGLLLQALVLLRPMCVLRHNGHNRIDQVRLWETSKNIRCQSVRLHKHMDLRTPLEKSPAPQFKSSHPDSARKIAG